MRGHSSPPEVKTLVEENKDSTLKEKDSINSFLSFFHSSDCASGGCRSYEGSKRGRKMMLL